ncbi:MAG: LysM peptidoglycan-binding domain-containing protein [Acidobacteria bacterium]|nr:LysM peptidoglycan-binding domain-containing protein [Acidobacteriota bacterium]
MSTPVRMTGSSPIRTQQGNTALVRHGESLQDFAAAQKVSVESLLAANPNIKSADQIRPGMELRLPGGQSSPIGGSRVSNLPGPLPRPLDGFERLAAGASERFASVADLPLPNPSPLSGAAGADNGDGESPGPLDPIPEGRQFEAVPLYHLQQALRRGGELGATPINLPNQTDPKWPGPVPPGGAEAGPPIGPDPIRVGVLFQGIGLRADQDVPEGPPPEPEPIPEPPNLAVGGVFYGIGLQSVQDVEPGPSPEPDPDPIPDGKSHLGDRLTGASAQTALGVKDSSLVNATPIQIP